MKNTAQNPFSGLARRWRGSVSAQHAAGAAEPALGFGPGVVSSSMVSWYFQTRAAREPRTRNTYHDATPLTELIPKH